MVDEARSEVEKLKDSARQEGSAAVNQIKSVAESDVHNAQETGQSLINNQKENLANRFSEYAKAIETDYLREKQPAELLDDLESLARRKPGFRIILSERKAPLPCIVLAKCLVLLDPSPPSAAL